MKNLCYLFLAVLLLYSLTAIAQDSLNVNRLSSIYTQVNNSDGVAISGDYAYIATYEGMAVLDISDPSDLAFAGFCGLQGYGEGIAIQDNYAYEVGNFSGLHVIDISNPTVPVEVGWCTLPEYVRDVAVSGQYAYVANNNDGLKIIDVSNPSTPIIVGDLQGTAKAVDVSGSYAYLGAGGAGMRIVDVSNPARPVEVDVVNTPGAAQGVTIAGNFAYVADGDEGLRIIDVHDPLNAVLMGGISFGSTFVSEAYDVAVSGSYAYVGVGGSSYISQNGIRVVDVSNPLSPLQVGSCHEPGYAYDVAISGQYVYASSPFLALESINVESPSNPTPASYYSDPGIISDIVVEGDYAYVASGDRFRIVDVSDPAIPEEVGQDQQVTTYYLDVEGDYAYLSEGKGGFLVMDISNPSAPQPLGNCFGGYYVKKIAVIGNYAYIADAILRINDISDPNNPSLIGSCDLHDQCCGVDANEEYVYVTTDGFLHVVDTSDPTAPVQVAYCDNLPEAAGVDYCEGMVFAACGSNGLHILDVSDPVDPYEIGWVDTPGSARNVVVSGMYAFVADLEQGLRIFDISNPTSPSEVGYYDTPGLAQNISVDGTTVFVAEGYCMGVYEFTPSFVSVNLIPFTDPIQIPSNGGSFDYYLFAENSTTAIQDVDIWSEVIFPDGSVMNPILGPLSLSLNAGTTGWYRQQNVPANAPSGEYTYIACSGDFPDVILSSDSLQFTKLASDNRGIGADDWSNHGDPFESNDVASSQPSTLKLISIHPNPFNPTTTITFDLPVASEVRFYVYDINGRNVWAGFRTSRMDPGTHTITFDGLELSSGIYFYRLETGEHSAVGKMVLIK